MLNENNGHNREYGVLSIQASEVEWGKPLDLDKLEDALRSGDFKALTIVHNETSTGAMYPIDKVGELAVKYDVLYMVDTLGLNAEEFLAENDSYHFFSKLGDLIFTGSTDTNVGDISLLLVL